MRHMKSLTTQSNNLATNEQMLFSGKNVTRVIFNLNNNFRWKD